LFEAIAKTDKETAEILGNDLSRQQNILQMIASENYVSEAVLEAQGSPLTNKYAEGYPGRRYYQGCANADQVETLAIERAKKLFNAPHANVQPHAGSQANMAALLCLLKPGDTMMGMNLQAGGHLTHGHSVNFSGILFKSVQYNVSREDELVDFAELRKLAKEAKPKVIIAGATAYPRTVDFAAFREVADEVGAYLMADIAHPCGLIAAGQHPSPFPHAHVVTSTTHKTLRGPRGGMVLCTEELAKGIDKMVFPGLQGGPLMHVIAAKAVCFREAAQDDYVDYQKQVIKNAKAIGEALVAGGLRLVSGGTDTHLNLVDLSSKQVTGKAAAIALERAGITVNYNSIPYDTQKPMVTSGIRIGTAALSTRGMKEDEMKQVAAWILRVLDGLEDEKVQESVRQEIAEFSGGFPIYAG
jgi:glycine hydroxymethyltransferase